jgi:hypothetical protein
MEKPSRRNLFDDDSDEEEYTNKVGGGILAGGDPVEEQPAKEDPVPANDTAEKEE